MSRRASARFGEMKHGEHNIEPNHNSVLRQRLLSVDEAAKYLGLSSWSLRKRLSQGMLPVIRIGKRILFDLHDLDFFIEQHKIRY